MDWKEHLSNKYGQYGGMWLYEQMKEVFIPELIAAVIEDIPSSPKHVECRDGLCEPCDACGLAFYAVGLKQKMREKWL